MPTFALSFARDRVLADSSERGAGAEPLPMQSPLRGRTSVVPGRRPDHVGGKPARTRRVARRGTRPRRPDAAHCAPYVQAACRAQRVAPAVGGPTGTHRFSRRSWFLEFPSVTEDASFGRQPRGRFGPGARLGVGERSYVQVLEPDRHMAVPVQETDVERSYPAVIRLARAGPFDIGITGLGHGPDDLDLAEVYDLSTAMELDWYEQIGICAPGEAEKLVRDGATTIGGRIPVNASGGLASFGEAVPAQVHQRNPG